MIKLKLSDVQQHEIAEAIDDPSTTERAKIKLLAIRLHCLDMPHGHIAAALNISDDTVTKYLKAFRNGGIAELIENRQYRPTSSVEPFLEIITSSLTDRPVATAKEAAHRIEQITGVHLSEDQARRIMKRVGMAYRKTASIPGGADPQMQLVFLQEELVPRLQEAREGTRRVFFVDAAHFVLGAFLGMIWCLTRVLVRTGSGRQRYSVLGAVETRDHDLVSIRTTGSVNAQTVCELIEKIAHEYPAEEITLVMDNARYQRNADVFDCAARNGIELLFLPAYSPNLNLIERVWRLIKSRTLRNKYFPDFATFRGGIDSFLDSLSGTNRHLLKSLVTENFQTFRIPTL
jgi:transposase